MAIETHTGTAVFNVRNYGASGQKDQDAQGLIQRAIDECAQAGGGMVYFPPGAYTTGTLFLRSHVRIHVEAGATLYSSKDPAAFVLENFTATERPEVPTICEQAADATELLIELGLEAAQNRVHTW